MRGLIQELEATLGAVWRLRREPYSVVRTPAIRRQSIRAHVRAIRLLRWAEKRDAFINPQGELARWEPL